MRHFFTFKNYSPLTCLIKLIIKKKNKENPQKYTLIIQLIIFHAPKIFKLSTNHQTMEKILRPPLSTITTVSSIHFDDHDLFASAITKPAK